MDHLKSTFNRVFIIFQKAKVALRKVEFYGISALMIMMLTSVGSVQAASQQRKTAALAIHMVGFLNKKVQPSGVCLYSEPNFKGDRICFTSSQAVLSSAWDNQVSSVGISTTYYAVFHDGQNFGGTSSATLQVDQPTLAGFDNLISSITIAELDADSDGVNDYADQCPDTPPGHAAQADGCALSQIDTDNDGVSDADDRCAGNPAGDVVGIFGCTLDQDSDGDGVIDRDDSYPFQFSTQCTP